MQRHQQEDSCPSVSVLQSLSTPSSQMAQSPPSIHGFSDCWKVQVPPPSPPPPPPGSVGVWGVGVGGGSGQQMPFPFTVSE